MSRGTVLVVDDERDVRSVCKRSLSQLGYDVTEAASGAEALAMVRANNFDLVLLDFRMPDTDGLETFRLIKAIQPGTVGVMMTAYAAVDNAVKAVNLGFSGFLLKPFRLGELQAAVDKALAKKESASGEARAAALASLGRISEVLSGRDLETLMNGSTQMVMQETQSDAAALLFRVEGRDGGDKVATSGRPVEWRRDVLSALVLGEGLAMSLGDLRMPPSLSLSLERSGMGHIAVVALEASQRSLGLLATTRSSDRPPYSPADLGTLKVLAAQTAVALSNAWLFNQVVEGERLNQALQRYLSPRTVQAVLSGEMEPGGVGVPRLMTVLLADVVDFSGLVERADIQGIIEVMHEYFSSAVEIISAQHGVVDELSGDKVLATFEQVQGREDAARRAVRAGLQMLERLDELRAAWHERGLPSVDVGIGVSTGPVAIGAIGAGERRAVMTAGRILTLAARSQSMTRQVDLRMIITQRTFEEVRDIITYRELGALRLKGFSEPIGLYGVQGLRGRSGSDGA